MNGNRKSIRPVISLSETVGGQSVYDFRGGFVKATNFKETRHIFVVWDHQVMFQTG